MSKRRNNTTAAAPKLTPVQRFINDLHTLSGRELAAVMSACEGEQARRARLVIDQNPPSEPQPPGASRLSVTNNAGVVTMIADEPPPPEVAFEVGWGSAINAVNALVMPSTQARFQLEIAMAYTVGNIARLLPINAGNRSDVLEVERSRREALLDVFRGDELKLRFWISEVERWNQNHTAAGLFQNLIIDASVPKRLLEALQRFLSPITDDPLGEQLRAMLPDINAHVEAFNRAVELGKSRIDDATYRAVMRAIELAMGIAGGKYQRAIAAAASEYGVNHTQVKNYLYKHPGIKPHAIGDDLPAGDDQP